MILFSKLYSLRRTQAVLDISSSLTAKVMNPTLLYKYIQLNKVSRPSLSKRSYKFALIFLIMFPSSLTVSLSLGKVWPFA
jgi:hypothetical protein